MKQVSISTDLIRDIGPAEFVSLAAAISKFVHSGDTLACEGFTHLIPYAASHEIIRQQISNLTLIRMTPDLIYDQMIGMGLVKKLIFSYAGNPGVGLLRRLRDSLEKGWPNKLEIEEHSHSAMAQAYEAGASGLSLAVFRGYKGSDLVRVNQTIASITCPFSGEILSAVPAIRPDVTIIHAQRANARGDVLIEGIVGVQKEAVLAAKRAVIVTVEEVVDNFNKVHINACILPRWCISAIAVVPGGSNPSYAYGYYQRDNNAYLEWDSISADRSRFLKWMQLNVLEATPEDFQDRVKLLRNNSSADKSLAE